MGGELAKVIEDFLRAVDVEALRAAKSIGKDSLSQYGVHPSLVVSCRARPFTRASPSEPYQGRL